MIRPAAYALLAAVLLAAGFATAAGNTWGSCRHHRCHTTTSTSTSMTTPAPSTTTTTTSESTTTTAPPLPSSSPLALFRVRGGEPYGDVTRYGWIVLHDNDAANIPLIRAQNPAIKILMYKDGPGVVDPQPDGQDWNPSPDGVQYSYMQAHPYLWLRDSAGSMIASPGWPNIHWADVGSDEYRQVWLQNVLAYLASTDADGVMIDDANFGSNQIPIQQGGVYSTQYPTFGSWDAAMRGFLAYVGAGLQHAGYLAVANVAAEWDQPVADIADWASLLTGVSQENWLRWGTGSFLDANGWNIWTDRERAVVAEGRVHLAMLSVASTAETDTMRYGRFSHALFEQPGLGAFAADIPNTDPADPSWTVVLGDPLGPATFDGTVWSRPFANATIHVNPATREAWTG